MNFKNETPVKNDRSYTKENSNQVSAPQDQSFGTAKQTEKVLKNVSTDTKSENWFLKKISFKNRVFKRIKLENTDLMIVCLNKRISVILLPI